MRRGFIIPPQRIGKRNGVLRETLETNPNPTSPFLTDQISPSTLGAERVLERVLKHVLQISDVSNGLTAHLITAISRYRAS